MNRVVLVGSVLLLACLGPVAAQDPELDPGLDPGFIVLPSGKKRVGTKRDVPALTRSDHAVLSRLSQGVATRADREQAFDALRQALHDPFILTRLAARDAMLITAQRQDGVLTPQQLVELAEVAFSSPYPGMREAGSVLTGILIRIGEKQEREAVQQDVKPKRGFIQMLQDSPVLKSVNRGPGAGTHMANAVAMNRERKAEYEQATEGLSSGLSTLLIENEESWLTTKTLAFMDWAAHDFNARGIPVIAEDVIPLRPLPIDTPLVHSESSQALAASGPYAGRERLRLLDDRESQVERQIEAWKERVGERLSKGDYEGVAEQAYAFIKELKQVEREQGMHYAMTRHLVATIGYGALRAHQRVHVKKIDRWGFDFPFLGFDMSPGDISKLYLDSTLYALPGFVLDIDREAQRVHRETGVGIIVNEFPGGFFSFMWETHLRNR